MRVLVVSNLYPPNAMGGYELSCRDVVDRWRERGHEVTVLTTTGSVTGVVEPSVAEPHVVRALQWYWSEHAFLTPPWRQMLATERHNLAVLRRLLADRPDVVSVWHAGGLPLGLLTAVEDAGVPMVLNVCDDWPDYGVRADAWTSWWSRLPLVARAAGARLTGVPTTVPDLDAHPASFVSAFTLDRLRARTPWRFPDAEVVGSGIDPRDFPCDAREPDAWRGELLCLGRVEPRKGFGTAVRALPLLPGCRLRVVGVADPAHRGELEGLARDLGVADRVAFTAVPRSEVRQVLAEADALLFTSTWDEPFGLTPLEAMSQCTPVVATRQGGSAEFLDDGVNCLAVPPGDAEALAAAVTRLAGDPRLRADLVREGLVTAARFTTDRLADVLEALHERAASS